MKEINLALEAYEKKEIETEYHFYSLYLYRSKLYILKLNLNEIKK